MEKIAIMLLSLLAIAVPTYAQEQLVLTYPCDPITEVSGKVLSEAYQQLGIQVTLKKYPSLRSIEVANDGDADGEVSRFKEVGKIYSNLLMVPVAVNVVEGVAFTKNVTFVILGWDSLRPYRIGIKRGTKFIQKGTMGMDVEAVSSNEQLFLKLNEGRNDVIVCGRLAGLVQLKQLRLKGIQMLEPPLATVKLYHYLHKKHSFLVSGLTKVLQDMETEGRIEEIRKQSIKKIFK